MVAAGEKLIWGPSRNSLYNLAGSFGRRLCCKLLTDPLSGVCASLAPRRRPKLQRHIHTCYFLAAPWRQGRVLSRAAAAAAANRLGEEAAGESGGDKKAAFPISLVSPIPRPDNNAGCAVLGPSQAGGSRF